MTGPRSISKDATRIYSTWFSEVPRGYCDLWRFEGRESAFRRRGARIDECCDEGPIEGVLDLELGSEVRSVSAMGICGDLDGLELCDICDGEREMKDDIEVRWEG